MPSPSLHEVVTPSLSMATLPSRTPSYHSTSECLPGVSCSWGCNVSTAEKIDLYRAFRSEYVTPKKPALVDVGPARYLTVDGQGAPSGEWSSTVATTSSTCQTRAGSLRSGYGRYCGSPFALAEGWSRNPLTHGHRPQPRSHAAYGHATRAPKPANRASRRFKAV